jgi:chromosome segregation protein
MKDPTQTRLKSLELHGYKTFASRHLFEFAGPITAIVGPNGSGKSNIVDALRWVLGEQSFSLLRGKKTEDMIFSGSEGRSRAGMASVTVIFDNSDGWLPIDYAEVAIMRRAYRDGQNEYLINGQRVRLKDVSELLAQAGLAERTYTIIGQGLVDAALSLRADERRRLFEEAAGIGLYRSRREEALKRLDVTRRNLDRVQDILAELAPRLRSLERQARRALEFEQAQADLKEVLLEWYGYHWHRTQADLVRAQEVAQAQENVLEETRIQQSNLSQRLGARRARIQTIRVELNERHHTLAELHSRREQAGRELAVADERARALSAQQESARSEQLQTGEALKFYNERRAAIEAELAAREEELQEAERQVAGAAQALTSILDQQRDLESHMQELRRAVNDQHAELDRLRARRVEREAQASRLAGELGELLEAVRHSEAELGRYEVNWTAANQALLAATTHREQAEAERNLRQDELRASEVERRELLDRLAGLGAERGRLSAELDVLDQAEEALSGYAEGTRVLLQAAREAHFQGATGALSSQLEVEATYEIAIAAALGEFLDSVVLQDGNEVDRALDLITTQGLRSALLPIQQIKTHRPLQPPQLEGILGIAADLVVAPQQIQPAVALLLGDVLVVRDRQVALQALTGQPTRVRAVTLRGEVFYAGGPVATGSGGSKANAPTGLSRSRRRREILAELAALEREEAGLARQKAELDARLTDLNARVKEMETSFQNARQAEEQARTRHERARLEQEQARRQLAWQTRQQETLEGEIVSGQTQTEGLDRAIQAGETQLAEQQARQKQLQAKLNELDASELQAQLTHWKTSQAVTERAIAEIRIRQQETHREHERVTHAIASLEARLAGYVEAIAAIEAEKQQLQQTDRVLGAEIEELQKLILPAEAEINALETEQYHIQTEEAGARGSLAQAEHRHAQARIALNKQLDTLASLQRRIEDDFGLVHFEYADEVSGPTPLPLEGMVERLPVIPVLAPELEDTLARKRAQLRRMGPVNPDAQQEYREVKERFEFMTAQVADLEQAEADIRAVILEMEQLMRQEFHRTFEAVALQFKDIFTRLFGGGQARLVLTDPDDLTNTGIDIEARLPGRRAQGLSLLSGGERSLTATALVFALLKTSPTPFCVLDEVDAMLDEANVGRFRDLLKDLSQETQFLIITHNRNTVQVADVIYGVTMGKDSTSQTLSLKLDQVA